MGLFSKLSRTASTVSGIVQNSNVVKNSRKAIFEMRDRLRGTSQFSTLFYAIINDINHPPRNIEATQLGEFWSESWDSTVNNYEPYATQKYIDSNIGYCEGCAIYLLIQECYPNVYDFPGNSVAAIEGGATIKLIMKKEFIGKTLKPAVTPQPIKNEPSIPNVQNTQYQTPAFCCNCGTKLASNTAFCPCCGNKI